MDEDWVAQNQKKISSAFLLFDKEKKGTVIQEEVPTIMRYLGVYPTEQALVKEILPEMQEDEPAAFVKYGKLEEVMLRLLASKEWEPDSEDVLLQAFKTIDSEDKGYIEWDTMRDLLQAKGTPFRDKECEQFQSIARDVESGCIYYEDYVALLAQDLNDNE